MNESSDPSDPSDPSDRRWDRWRKRFHIIAGVAQIATKSQLQAPAGQPSVFFWRVNRKKFKQDGSLQRETALGG